MKCGLSWTCVLRHIKPEVFFSRSVKLLGKLEVWVILGSQALAVNSRFRRNLRFWSKVSKDTTSDRDLYRSIQCSSRPAWSLTAKSNTNVSSQAGPSRQRMVNKSVTAAYHIFKRKKEGKEEEYKADYVELLKVGFTFSLLLLAIKLSYLTKTGFLSCFFISKTRKW